MSEARPWNPGSLCMCGCGQETKTYKGKHRRYLYEHRPKGGRKAWVSRDVLDHRDRFCSFVHPEPNSGCHIWGGQLAREGYGGFSWGRSGTQYAHRIAWYLAGNSLSKGQCILHKCDNRLCVNPDHLFTGTRGDNNRDRDRKGRGVKGPYPTGVRKSHNKYTVTMTLYGGAFNSIEEATRVSELMRELRPELEAVLASKGITHG